tara:strand:+ start:1141 stop:1263 length:123 start_codon:yes stop_codon:yes gene_type:complete
MDEANGKIFSKELHCWSSVVDDDEEEEDVGGGEGGDVGVV